MAIQMRTVFMGAFEHLDNKKGFSGISKTKKFMSSLKPKHRS